MVKWIADAGSNHNRDWGRTECLIREAKGVGCQAVKFQLFRGDRLYTADLLEARETAEGRELPPDFVPKIAAVCKELGLEFHCTPFDMESAVFLKPYVDAYKIASSSVLDLRLIEWCARTGKPLSLSAGAATDDEFSAAFRVARTINHRVTVFHCCAQYPAPPAACAVKRLGKLKRIYQDVGWSDHTGLPAVIHYAVALGAQTVEFHLDLGDLRGAEAGHGHCWTPAAVRPVIADTQAASGALGELWGEWKPSGEAMKMRNDPGDEMRPLKEHRHSGNAI